MSAPRLRVVIPGGTGQIGTVLARALHRMGHEVTVLSRRPRPGLPWRCEEWDGGSAGAWTRRLEGADALINLCGRSVNCRYTAANRREILDSRTGPTRSLGEALARLENPPRVWLQASTATIYEHTYGPPNDEFTGREGGAEPGVPAGWQFGVEVARAWEGAARAVPLPRTRLVLLRISLVMNPDPGSVFDVLLALVRRGLGGPQGNGRQFVSWIHEADLVAAVPWLMAHEEVSGPVNLASPRPLPNAEFMAALRAAWGMRVGLPAPAWLLEAGAVFLRTETELILKSRRVVPGVLARGGFEFRYPEWASAARDLCRRWRLRPSGAAPARLAGETRSGR
ncbi:MAG TPA: TIGR01777 family oxidoreductase [Opitutaceae bacterium]|nr:TIGR01777 family oxidoreductase [Opitutaceae bacterium]